MPSIPASLKPTREVSRPDIVFRIARVPGSPKAFVAGSDFKVYEADLSKPKPDFREIGAHASYVTGLVVAGGGPVSAGYDGRLVWWDADKAAAVRSVEAHAKWVRDLAASPDGAVLASVADDMTCKLWDAATGKHLHELRGHAEKTPHHFPSMLYAVAFSPDGKHVATGDKVGVVNVWEVASGQPAARLEAPVMYTWDPVARRHSIGGVRALAFSPDGSRLAVGGMGKVGNIDHLEGPARVEVFDWRAGTRTHEFGNNGFKGLVERLLFHPHGDWLLAVGGANDGFALAFDLPAKKVGRGEKVAMHVHDAALTDAADGAWLVGHGRIVHLDLKA